MGEMIISDLKDCGYTSGEFLSEMITSKNGEELHVKISIKTDVEVKDLLQYKIACPNCESCNGLLYYESYMEFLCQKCSNEFNLKTAKLVKISN